MNMIQILLIQIGVILALSRVMGMLMRQVNQPQVVGEMIAGILLGPSLLGLFHHGAWMNALFPRSSLENLDVLSQMGVMLFMFLVGLEMDPKLLRGQGKAALVTGTVGIVIPFLLGGALAIALLHMQHEVTGGDGAASRCRGDGRGLMAQLNKFSAAGDGRWLPLLHAQATTLAAGTRNRRSHDEGDFRHHRSGGIHQCLLERHRRADAG